jgi:hypothetical protein
MGLGKSDQIYMKEMDEKLKMVDDNYEFLEHNLENIDELEMKLGLPISKTA